MKKNEVLGALSSFDPQELFISERGVRETANRLAQLEKQAAENLADAEKQSRLDLMIRVAPLAMACDVSVLGCLPPAKWVQAHKSDRNGSGLLRLAAAILNCGS